MKAFFIFLFLFITVTGNACSCVYDNQSYGEAYKMYDLIVIGQVIKVNIEAMGWA